MRKLHRRLTLLLTLVSLPLTLGHRLASPVQSSQNSRQRDHGACCTVQPSADQLHPSNCSCSFSLPNVSLPVALSADEQPHLPGIQTRRLLARRRPRPLPLRVSHNRYSHDLVALSHAGSQGGLSREKAHSHLQRLGGGTPNPLERMLVVAQYREDLTWLKHVDYLPSIIYQADNASAHNKVIRNMGETAVYLQYIVDHYDVLPKQMAFVHGHRKAKHMPDVVPVLQNLQWGRFGYANLRYINITLDQWGVWTGDWLHPSWPEQAPPRPEIIWDDLRISMSRNYAQMWGLLFEHELGPLPEYVHAPCCAEFVVSSQRVRRHSRQFYASLLDWLRHTSNDRFWAGRIFEYVWHIMFGEDPVYTAPQKCDLLHCAG